MCLIELNEGIGIKNIKVFYNDLVQKLHTSDEVILDFKDVKRVDLSVVQVLMSAQKYAKNVDKIIRLKNISAAIKNQLKITGLIK